MKRLLWLVPVLLALVVALWLNHTPKGVRGVDVSHYQGQIDWPTLAGQGIEFAYIKATEGSGYVDSYFQTNLEGAMDAGLAAGAYHFFSYDSPGERQAAHFIETVPDLPGMLPPAIDVEFYGDYDRHPADAEAAVKELQIMVEALEAHYGRKPVIYATQKSYRLYIDGRFDDCPLWIRNVFFTPRQDWTFWQYTDRASLKGYEGDTPYVDMNVYSGKLK